MFENLDILPNNTGSFSSEPAVLAGITEGFNSRRCMHGAPRLAWSGALAAAANNVVCANVCVCVCVRGGCG